MHLPVATDTLLIQGGCNYTHLTRPQRRHYNCRPKRCQAPHSTVKEAAWKEGAGGQSEDGEEEEEEGEAALLAAAAATVDNKRTQRHSVSRIACGSLQGRCW